MAIPAKQIGWSQKSNLLWQISKQLEILTGVLYRSTGSTTTTTSTTTATPTTTTTTSSSSTTTTSTSTSTSTTTTTTTVSPTTTTTTTATPTTTTTTTAPTYTVGQAALGGTIAYILQPGDPGYSPSVQHGLVATVADVSTNALWGCSGVTMGATGTAIGTGNANTIAIMAGCSTAGIAARVCGDLVQGGYSDWYLPSLDELNKLYENKTAIGGFTNVNPYWSSSESPFFNTIAKCQFFYPPNSGLQSDVSKNSSCFVRAIRSF